MKKIYLFVLFAVTVFALNAQNPTVTLTAQVDGNTRNLVLATSVAGTKYQIDWGNGELQETTLAEAYDGWNATTVTGTPAGEGAVKVYGDHLVYFECSSHVDGAKVTSIDVTNATELTQLYVYTNSLTTLDVSKNTALERLDCYNNPLTSLDLSANTALTRLDAKNMNLESIDLSHNTALNTLYLSDNAALTSVDLSANTALKSLYILNAALTSIDLSANTALTYVSLNNNKLTSLDVTACTNLGTLFCLGNELTELKADNVTKNVNCSNNKFTLATLPVLNIKTFTYAPQKPMAIAETVEVNGLIDLSAQNHIKGLATEEQTTVYTWKTAEGTVLTAGEDYNEADGVFTFLKEQELPVYCEMTTGAFPKFTGANAFKTTEVLVQKGTGIVETATTDVKVSVAGSAVTVSGLAQGEPVNVYSVSGMKVAQAVAEGGKAEMTLPAGIHLVVANGQSYKVVVR